MDTDIKKLSVIELKALKSDIYESISINQQNLQIINQELEARRQNDKPKEETKEKVKN